jgi:hypothetical protein
MPESLSLAFVLATCGQYNKTLWICILWQMTRFESKFVSYILSVTETTLDKHAGLLWNL